MKKYLVSYPLVALSIGVAVLTMVIYYKFEHMTQAAYKDTAELSMLDNLVLMIPSTIYSFAVIPLNMIYKEVAVWLTEWGKRKLVLSHIVIDDFAMIYFWINFRKPSHTSVLREQFDDKIICGWLPYFLTLNCTSLFENNMPNIYIYD